MAIRINKWGIKCLQWENLVLLEIALLSLAVERPKKPTLAVDTVSDDLQRSNPMEDHT
jgi:hypothetical protein